MRNIKILSVLSGLMILFVGNAFATTNSQILVMSKQLYQIAQDLTTGMLPTAILLIAIGDPEALRNDLTQVYQESIKSVQSNFLDAYYKDNNPFDYAQNKGTGHVEFLVFLKEAENTYSVEWREIERNYDNQILGESHYKALISVIQIPHTSEDQYREDPLNPFGLYVTSLSWSKLM